MACKLGSSSKHTFLRLTLALVTNAFLCVGQPVVQSTESAPTVETDPDLMDVSCLKSEPRGCRFLKNAEQCLSSRDGGDDAEWFGLKARGERCVWCGGKECRENAHTLCEPYDFIMNGEKKKVFNHFKAKDVHRVAGCKNGRPAALEKFGYAVRVPGYTPPLGQQVLVPYWVPKRPSAEDVACLKKAPGGCRSLKTMGECLSRKDGGRMKEFKGFKEHGEPCVWCGGGQCQETAFTLCEPFDFLMYGEGVAFNTFFEKANFRVAGCHGGVVPGGIPKPAFDYNCLKETDSYGCPGLRTPHACLSHKDGRPEKYSDGLKIHAEPCVWCGGSTCVENHFSLCEPFDWVINGQGQAFNLFIPKTTFRMAACTYNKSFPHSYYGPTEMNPGMLNQAKVPNNPLFLTPPESTLPESTAPERKALQAVLVDKEVSRRMGFRCWDNCGQQAGYCEWCGNSNACCRRGWSQDPAECPKDGNHSTAHHVCTDSAMAGVSGRVVLPRPPLASTFKETDNSFSRWAWLIVPLLVVLAAVPVTLLCCTHGRKKTPRALLFRGGLGESESSEDEALVRVGEASDQLFDTLDRNRNHDSIVTQSDFASAFGVPVTRPVPMYLAQQC